MTHTQVHVSSDVTELCKDLTNMLRNSFNDYVKRADGNPFVIGFSGGSMPKILIPIITNAIPVDKRVHIRLFPVDERLVPLDDAENNTKYYLDGLKGIFSEDQFAIVSRTGNESGLEACNYLNEKLREWTGSANTYPSLDILFLGIGPDGHTCSLFPGHSLLGSEKWTDVILDSPKPPSKRITVTLPLINNAKNVAVISTGSGKAQVLKEIIDEGSTEYPTGLVSLKNGNPVHYFIDSEAAHLLEIKRSK